MIKPGPIIVGIGELRLGTYFVRKGEAVPYRVSAFPDKQSVTGEAVYAAPDGTYPTVTLPVGAVEIFRVSST
jgi:hypothetical protein